MSGEGIRAKRVAESIRAYLAGALVRDVGDPRLASLVITHVGVPDDLSVAWITVRSLVSDETPAARRRTVESLNRAAGRLRKGLGPALQLKRVPELRFDYDTGHEASRRVESLLHEIAEERANREKKP